MLCLYLWEERVALVEDNGVPGWREVEVRWWLHAGLLLTEIYIHLTIVLAIACSRALFSAFRNLGDHG